MAGGQAASSPASFSSWRLTSPGTRNSTAPSRSPNVGSVSVSQGTEVAGSPYSARMLAPRCALTTNRNAGGVAAHQPLILSTVGRA